MSRKFLPFLSENSDLKEIVFTVAKRYKDYKLNEQATIAYIVEKEGLDTVRKIVSSFSNRNTEKENIALLITRYKYKEISKEAADFWKHLLSIVTDIDTKLTNSDFLLFIVAAEKYNEKLPHLGFTKLPKEIKKFISEDIYINELKNVKFKTNSATKIVFKNYTEFKAYVAFKEFINIEDGFVMTPEKI